MKVVVRAFALYARARRRSGQFHDAWRQIAQVAAKEFGRYRDAAGLRDLGRKDVLEGQFQVGGADANRIVGRGEQDVAQDRYRRMRRHDLARGADRGCNVLGATGEFHAARSSESSTGEVAIEAPLVTKTFVVIVVRRCKLRRNERSLPGRVAGPRITCASRVRPFTHLHRRRRARELSTLERAPCRAPHRPCGQLPSRRLSGRQSLWQSAMRERTLLRYASSTAI